jgi:hypothetical protein
LAADYRFFDTPQPLSPSESQVFQQLLALSSSGRDRIRNPGLWQFEEDFDIIVESKGLVAQPSA